MHCPNCDTMRFYITKSPAGSKTVKESGVDLANQNYAVAIHCETCGHFIREAWMRRAA